MNIRVFSLILGIVFVIVALCGFGQFLNSPYTGPHLTLPSEQGDLLGLFRVNMLHNIVHLLFGVAGIFVYFAGASAARSFCQITGVIYILLAIVALIPVPALQSTFGLIPINGHDIWLHAVIAIVALYFGFAAPATTSKV